MRYFVVYQDGNTGGWKTYNAVPCRTLKEADACLARLVALYRLPDGSDRPYPNGRGHFRIRNEIIAVHPA